MNDSGAVGVWGEVYAARYLRDHGYRICMANFKTRLGEVDIVAERDGVLSFIEVKTRTEGMIARPSESVTREKQRKLSFAAKQYFQITSVSAPARFDVIEVYLDGQHTPVQIVHIPDAFDEIH